MGTYSGRWAGEGGRSWAADRVQGAGPRGSLGVAKGRVLTPASVLRL